jgi:hypothetical protein
MGLKNLMGLNKKEKEKNKAKEQPDAEAAAGKKLASKIAILEEQVSGKAKELAQAEQQIKNLTLSTDDTAAQPHGPLGELEVPVASAVGDGGESTPVDTPANPTAGFKTASVRVGAGAASEAAPSAAASTPPAAAAPAPEAQNDGGFSSIFAMEDTEENPLAALINALPDVTAQELMNDLGEIKDIIREWQHSK